MAVETTHMRKFLNDPAQVVKESLTGLAAAHSDLLRYDAASQIIVRKDGRDYFLAVGEGLVEVTGDQVAILTDMAIAAEKIDEAKVQEARQRAEARLSEKLSEEEVASVNSSLARSLAQLHVKRRQHH